MYQLLLLLNIISHINYLKLHFSFEKNFLSLFWIKYESFSDQEEGRSERIMLIFDKQCIIELLAKSTQVTIVLMPCTSKVPLSIGFGSVIFAEVT
jgi:hypothetical protein